MPWQKKVADLFTLSRAIMAPVVVWIGVEYGAEGIEAVMVLLLVAATLDTLDGYFARLSRSPVQTWIGAHDVLFDVTFSTSLLVYLVLAERVPVLLAAVHGVTWLWIFTRQRAIANSFAVLYQGPIYLVVVIAAVNYRAPVLIWLLSWLALAGVFAWRRFFTVRVPAFFDDLQERIAGGRGRGG